MTSCHYIHLVVKPPNRPILGATTLNKLLSLHHNLHLPYLYRPPRHGQWLGYLRADGDVGPRSTRLLIFIVG